MGEVFEGVKMKAHDGHRMGFGGMGMVEVSDGVSSVGEFRSLLPFPFLLRKPLPMYKVLKVVPMKAKVKDLFNLLLFEALN